MKDILFPPKHSKRLGEIEKTKSFLYQSASLINLYHLHIFVL